MDKIITGIQMELKSLRLFKWQVFISIVILPFSYVFVMLLFGNIQRNDIPYLLSGYLVASLIGFLYRALCNTGMRFYPTRSA